MRCQFMCNKYNKLVAFALVVHILTYTYIYIVDCNKN